MMRQPDKEARYDRQLRLWAANGQEALESTRIALLNGSALGTETLKNLILPGIGGYTVIDHRTVSERDTGVNFFLDVDCIGLSRAQKITEYLQELNPDVVGDFLNADVAHLIRENVSYLSSEFDLVLATGLDPESLQLLGEALWAASVPLIVTDAIGFTGFLRLAVREHTIVESHPDAIVDLRLDQPWPELASLAAQLDLRSLTDNEHTHVPYILLLLQYLAQWRDQHQDHAPTTFEEKSQFKAMIRAGMRNVDEDNFDEAVNNVWRACSRTTVPSSVTALLCDPAAQHLTPKSSDFWFLVRSLADFVTEHGLLPVAGTVPDMKSDTTTFIRLQKTYRAKAMTDIAAVKLHLVRHLREQQRPSNAIADQEIESFCKHAAYIRVIRYRSLADQKQSPRVSQITQRCASDADDLIFWYLAKNACDTFKAEKGYFPGEALDLTEDAYRNAHESLVRMVLQEYPDLPNQQSLAQACEEMTRSGHGELHNIASLMGGMAAQEIIKIITKQYVPLNNTVIFDGIKSASAVYEL